jgi:hypothetical protein
MVYKSARKSAHPFDLKNAAKVCKDCSFPNVTLKKNTPKFDILFSAALKMIYIIKLTYILK